jgi:hypothetical protein
VAGSRYLLDRLGSISQGPAVVATHSRAWRPASPSSSSPEEINPAAVRRWPMPIDGERARGAAARRSPLPCSYCVVVLAPNEDEHHRRRRRLRLLLSRVVLDHTHTHPPRRRFPFPRLTCQCQASDDEFVSAACKCR